MLRATIAHKNTFESQRKGTCIAIDIRRNKQKKRATQSRTFRKLPPIFPPSENAQTERKQEKTSHSTRPLVIALHGLQSLEDLARGGAVLGICRHTAQGQFLKVLVGVARGEGGRTARVEHSVDDRGVVALAPGIGGEGCQLEHDHCGRRGGEGKILSWANLRIGAERRGEAGWS